MKAKGQKMAGFKNPSFAHSHSPPMIIRKIPILDLRLFSTYHHLLQWQQ
jgi:hypothetical protein